MKKVICLIILVLAIVLSCGFVFGAIANHVVISEVAVGIGSASNEFIEIYNPTSLPVSINNSNFKLKLVSSGDAVSTKTLTWINEVIPAHGFFLIATGNVGVDADATFSTAVLSSNSGVIITDNNNNVIDKIAWGNPAPSNGVEGTGVNVSLSTDKSIERKSGFASEDLYGNGNDTGNNSVDFFLQNTPNPQNSSSCVEGQGFISVAKQNCEHTSIQSAINAATAGDIMEVGAGTYDITSTVTINKKLTIQGAGKDLTIFSGNDQNQGIQDDAMFIISANEVTISDVTIDQGNDASDFSVGAYTDDVSSVDHLTIQNSKLLFSAHGTGYADGQQALHLGKGSHNKIINNIFDTASYNSGIYIGTGGQDYFTLSENTIINLSSLEGGVDEQDGGGTFINSFGHVANSNFIKNNFINTGIAIYLGAGSQTSTSNINVTENLFNSNNGNYGALFITSEAVGVATKDVVITKNKFLNTGMGDAVKLLDWSPTSQDVIINSIIVQNNTFENTDNFAINVDSSVTGGSLNSENNFFGSSTGPTHSSNPPGTGDAVSDNVDFTPWLNSPFDQPPSPVTIAISDTNGIINDKTPTLSLTSGTYKPDYMAFSCDNATFSAWIDWAATYDLFDMTAGAGCALADGQKTVYVKVKSKLGIEQTAHSSDSTVLDSVAPIIRSIILEDDYVRNFTYIKIWINVSDENIYRVWAEKMPLSISGSADNWTGNIMLIDGNQPINIFANDTAGNYVENNSLTFTIDNDPPVIHSAALSDDYINNNTQATVTVNINDNSLSSITANGITLDYQGNDIWSKVLTLTDANNKVTIVATDSADNVVTRDLPYTIDDLAPQITLVSPAAQYINSRTILLNVTLDAPADCNYTDENNVNKTLFTAKTQGNATLIYDADYSRTMRVYCIDAAGNKNFTFKDIVMDTQAPPININIINGTEYTENPFWFNINTNTDHSTCDYKLNNGNLTNVLHEGLDTSVPLTLAENPPDYSNTLQVFCHDLAGNTAQTDVITFTVNTNKQPIIRNLEDKSLNEDALFNFTINATDSNIKDLLTYSTNITIGTFNPLTGNILWTPTNADIGAYNVLITVCDNSTRVNNCTNGSFKITVVNTNDAPTITGLSDKLVTQGSLLNFTITATDEDVGSILKFYKNISSASLNEDTGYFSWTPNNTDVGVHNVLFKVCDNSGESNNCISQAIKLTVANLNEQPILGMVADMTVNEDTQLSFILHAEDQDLIHNDVLTYTSNLTGLVITKAINQTLATVTWTPCNSDVGIYNVLFMVNDSAGLNDTKSAILTVININDAPVLFYNQTVTLPENSSTTINLTQYTIDVDSALNLISYNVTLQDATKAKCTLENTILTIQATAKQGTTTNCRIMTSDGTNSSEFSFGIVVQDVDNPPELLRMVPNVSMMEDTVDVALNLNDYFTDVDSSMAFTTVPTVTNISITISNSGIVTIAPAKDFFGTRTVRFRATSNSKSVDSNDAVISVENDMADSPKIVSSLPASQEVIISEDVSQEFSVNVVDPDGEIPVINWSVVADQPWGTIPVVAGSTFRFDADYFSPGTWKIKAVAYDAALHNDSKEWTLIVSQVPVTKSYNMSFDMSQGINKATNVAIGSKAASGGKIDFGTKEIDLDNVVDVDSNVKIEQNLVAVNVDALPALNKSARVTMKITPVDVPVIFYDEGFKTNASDVKKVCSFCNIVSYDRVNGILVFDIAHFTSFTAREQSVAYSLGINPAEILFDGERNSNQIKEVVLSNSGSQVLENVELVLQSNAGINASIRSESGDYGMAISKFNLGSGQSKTFVVRSYIPDNAKASKTKIGTLSIMSSFKNKTVEIYQMPPTKLKILSVKVDDGDDEYFVKNNGKIDDIKPDSTLKFTVEVQNLYTDQNNEDQDIKGIDVDMRIKKILNDGKKDIKKSGKSFSLEATESDEETLEFEIPFDVNEKSSGYKIELIVDGKDDYGASHEDVWDMTLVIEKEEQDVRITSAKLQDIELSCGGLTYFDVKVNNYGSDEAEDVVIKVENKELGISEIEDAVPKLDKDVFDKDSYYSTSFAINVPKNAENKKYPITIIVYYDEDEESDRKTVDMDVKECTVTKEIDVAEKLKAETKEQLFEGGVQAQVYQPQPQEISGFKIDKSWTDTLMICGIIVFAGVLLFVLMAIIVSVKRKRKY